MEGGSSASLKAEFSFMLTAALLGGSSCHMWEAAACRGCLCAQGARALGESPGFCDWDDAEDVTRKWVLHVAINGQDLCVRRRGSRGTLDEGAQEEGLIHNRDCCVRC